MWNAWQETDAEYLEVLHATASAVRDPEILASAAALTTDGAATVAARVTGILTLVMQVQPGFTLKLGTAWTEVLTTPVGQECPISVGGNGAQYVSERQLQPDSTQRIATALDIARKDETAPQLVRDLAACARRSVRPWVPITVEGSLLCLTYVCGSRFRVDNYSDESVTVSFEVVGTDDRGGMSVRPASNKVFTVRTPGTVRLLYLDNVIDTVENGGTPCTE